MTPKTDAATGGNNFEITRLDRQHMKPDDLEALSQIARRTFYDTFREVTAPDDMQQFLDQAYAPAVLAEEIAQLHTAVFLARDKTTRHVAGYMKVNWLEQQTEAFPDHYIELQRIYVDTPYFGCGLARDLFARYLEIAQKLKATHMWLGVWEGNLRAQRFYSKYGFQITGKHTFIVGNDPQTDLIMEKEIEPSLQPVTNSPSTEQG